MCFSLCLGKGGTGPKNGHTLGTQHRGVAVQCYTVGGPLPGPLSCTVCRCKHVHIMHTHTHSHSHVDHLQLLHVWQARDAVWVGKRGSRGGWAQFAVRVVL